MSVYAGPKSTLDNLQIALDWGNINCYPGTGSEFFNLTDRRKNNGYIKNNCTYSPDNGGYIQTNGAQPDGANTVGDRININTSAAGIDRFSGTNNFTIIFWNYWISGSGKILSTGSAGSGIVDNCIWYMWIDNSQFYWWNSSGGTVNNITCPFNDTRIANIWQMVAVTYSFNEAGNNVARSYVNGVQVGIGTTPTATHSYIDRSNQTDMQWTLGGGYASSCVNSSSVNRFGPFFMFNRRLTDSEIYTNFVAHRGRYNLPAIIEEVTPTTLTVNNWEVGFNSVTYIVQITCPDNTGIEYTTLSNLPAGTTMILRGSPVGDITVVAPNAPTMQPVFNRVIFSGVTGYAGINRVGTEILLP